MAVTQKIISSYSYSALARSKIQIEAPSLIINGRLNESYIAYDL